MIATRFSGLARVLHWGMAAAVITMLGLGIFMVSTIGTGYGTAIALHRPLGIAILALALVRLAVRLRGPVPPLPSTLSPAQKYAAHGSHIVLYALMIAMPLIGWGMLSAGGYPVQLWSGFQLPPLLPQDAHVFGLLRQAHTVFAFALFGVVLLHLAAALFHALILRDGVFSSMASLKPGVQD